MDTSFAEWYFNSMLDPISRHISKSSHLFRIFYFARFFHTGCSSEFLSEFTATTHPLHVEEQLILARDPSVQSLLLVDHFCTANRSPVLARERWQTFENSWKKNPQYLLITLYKLWRDIDCSLNREIARPRYGAIHVRQCYLLSIIFTLAVFYTRARVHTTARHLSPLSSTSIFCLLI